MLWCKPFDLYTDARVMVTMQIEQGWIPASFLSGWMRSNRPSPAASARRLYRHFCLTGLCMMVVGQYAFLGGVFLRPMSITSFTVFVAVLELILAFMCLFPNLVPWTRRDAQNVREFLRVLGLLDATQIGVLLGRERAALERYIRGHLHSCEIRLTSKEAQETRKFNTQLKGELLRVADAFNFDVSDREPPDEEGSQFS